MKITENIIFTILFAENLALLEETNTQNCFSRIMLFTRYIYAIMKYYYFYLFLFIKKKQTSERSLYLLRIPNTFKNKKA